MKENYNLIGKKIIIEESKDDVISYLQEEWERSTQEKEENEIEKTKDELQTIEDAKNSINAELIFLGLNPNFDIKPEEVHIISNSGSFNKGGYMGGEYDSINRNINVFREQDKTKAYINILRKILNEISGYSMEMGINKDFNLKHILIHESTHKRSHHKYSLYENKYGRVKLNDYRVGYKISSPKGDFMRGFNEAVVESTTVDIVNRQRLSYGKKEIKSPTDYEVDIEIVDKIAEKIAFMKKETKEVVWKRFKTGQFTGNMMHLRDVERVYGPGSIRILASMEPGSNPTKLLYLDYFMTEDPSFRKILGQKIMEATGRINDDDLE